MDALFIGHNYTDVTFLTDYVPTGDEKYVGDDYAFGVGGNAVVAAFTCAKLGLESGLITQVADDRLGDSFLQRAATHGIRIFPRTVKKSSLSLILPNNRDKRAILRCRDTEYLTRPHQVRLKNVSVVHVDGHMPLVALDILKKARKQGILTSLDGGAVRPHIEEILEYIDVAVLSEDFSEQMKMNEAETFAYLKEKGVKVAAITYGSKGVSVWEKENDSSYHLDALDIPIEKIIDTTGAGDVFHGSYVYSYTENPEKTWIDHFKFARCASALCIQKMGAEPGIPTLEEVNELY
jgi:sugar/nucleoside kinase (ribokinase family)